MTEKPTISIEQYNADLSGEDKVTCELLFTEIARALPDAERKVWHRHPVWFINGNPIVGYSKLKNSVQLLFWSGQSFEEPGLDVEGSFKAAQARFTSTSQVKIVDLRRWLEKSKSIQWDYKNIVKRRGVLEKISI